MADLLQDKMYLILFLILFLTNCSEKQSHYWRINYKVLPTEQVKKLPNPEYINILSYQVIDKYLFVLPSGEHEIAQYLFQIKDHSDTLILIEYILKKEHPCDITYIKDAYYSSLFWKFNALDTTKINNNKYLIKKSGTINYKNYRNYKTVEGFFGCTDE